MSSTLPPACSMNARMLSKAWSVWAGSPTTGSDVARSHGTMTDEKT